MTHIKTTIQFDDSPHIKVSALDGCIALHVAEVPLGYNGTSILIQYKDAAETAERLESAAAHLRQIAEHYASTAETAVS